MNDNLKCLICHYKAPRIERLRCHMQVTHQGLRVACKLCDHTFTNSSNLNKHTRNKHDGVKFSCKYCERVYTENQTLNRHIDIEHMNKEREIFSCAECKKEFLSKFNFLRHIKIHQGILHACEKCDYKTSLGNTLTYHIKSKHKEVPLFDCDICDYKGRRKSLKAHKESKHGSERYKCKICDYVSTRREYLKKHIVGLHGNLVLSCGLCDYKCKSKNTLGFHKTDKHSNILHHCSKCDLETFSKSGLVKHIKRHNNITYKCDKCEKTFQDKRHLKIHGLNKHEGIVWPCTICPYKAAGPHILGEHMRHLHAINLTMKHKCPECDKTFRKKFKLTMHKRQHTGEKPNQCKNCLMTFRTSIKRNHRLGQCKVNIKKENGKIECILCPFSSENIDLLRLHAFSHQTKVSKIMEDLPQSLKEACFKTKEEFESDLNIFLAKSAEVKPDIDLFILKCTGTLVDCDECGNTLTAKSIKKHRQNVHKDQRHSECKNCGKYLHPDSLRRHMRTVHSGLDVKEMNLGIVDKKEEKDTIESSLENIATHLPPVKSDRVHIECKECGKSMNSKSMPKHMRTVHKKLIGEKMKNTGRKV